MLAPSTPVVHLELHTGDLQRARAFYAQLCNWRPDRVDTRHGSYLALELGGGLGGGIVECATEPAVIKTMDKGDVDLAILDGEAVPAGGLGIARQLKDEIFQCCPVLVLTGRPQDAWLATWSRAEAAVSHPIDPTRLAEATAGLLRQRVASLPATT